MAVSFGRRLTFFFLLLVVLPMVFVAVLVDRVTTESSEGKADARLAGSLEAALGLYRDEIDEARKRVRGAARDPGLLAALRDQGKGAVREQTGRVLGERRLRALIVIDPSGDVIATAGSRNPVAGAEIAIRGRDGDLASLLGSTVSARSYVDRVRELTGSDAAVLRDGRPLATTLDLGESALPSGNGTANVSVADGRLRAATTQLGGAPESVRLAVFGPAPSGGIGATSPAVAAALAGFFALALLLILLLARGLRGQVREMFDAARRVGSGDFSRQVPVEGDDEMAGLAREFNKMSGRLSEQMGELRRQRAEVERSVQRIGEAFASGLDRLALLEIVAETALGACDAGAARVVLAGRGQLEADAGDVDADGVGEALAKAIEQTLEDGKPSTNSSGGAVAIAEPIGGLAEAERHDAALAVARTGEPFDEADREMLRYLCGQAAVSVENIDLHELVSEQAVKDELTGLANPRRFRELFEKEAVRAQRFGHQLSLILLDIDDFKQVNDTHGHLQGDEVLRTVGRILQQESRGVDEPARYGGEEFIVVLPETGRDGALEVAERIRTAIAASRTPLIDRSGELEVTVSLGVASSPPDTASDTKSLVAAADAALYSAKRAGKNRTECAPAQSPGVAAQGQPLERRT